MAIVPAKTYQVLRAAGALEEDTIAVAEELAAYENRLGGIENRFGQCQGSSTPRRRSQSWVCS